MSNQRNNGYRTASGLSYLYASNADITTLNATNAIFTSTTSTTATMGGMTLASNTVTNCDNIWNQEISFTNTNLVANAENIASPWAAPGNTVSYVPLVDGTIKALQFFYDDVDGMYTIWTLGTIQWILYKNGLAAYTGTAYDKTAFATASSPTGSNRDRYIAVTGLSITVAPGDDIQVSCWTSMTFNAVGSEVRCHVYGLGSS